MNKFQCVVLQLGIVDSHFRANEVMCVVNLFDVIDFFTDVILYVSDFSCIRVINKDSFLITQPDMLALIEPCETYRSRQITEVLYGQFIYECEAVMDLVIPEYLSFFPDFP